MPQSNVRQLVRVLKAVANERRLRIVRLLAEDSRLSVGEIARAIGLSFRSTSHHLRLLRAADVVESEPSGLQVHYTLNPDHPQAELIRKITK